MRLFFYFFAGVLLFCSCNFTAKKDDGGYRIILNCDETAFGVEVIVINKTCYIYDTKDINAAIQQSGIDPADIKVINIVTEGASEQWQFFTHLLYEFEGRISGITEIVLGEGAVPAEK